MNAGSAAAAVSPVSAHARSAMITLVLLSLGHFFVDIYSGSLGVMQPYLVARFQLTLTQAGILGGILVFSSSVTQPLYGYLSDRYRSRFFSALGPAIAGVFILGSALAPSYAWAIVAMLIGGAAVSSFHPQATSWAAQGMARNRTFWMSVFITAGTLGIALAPAFFKEVITRAGFERLPWAALPGVVLSAFLLLLVREPANLPAVASRGFDWDALRAVRRPLSILYFGVFFRSAVQVTYAQFLVLYLSRERGYTIHQAAYALTAYLSAGAVGGVLGGRLSHRFGAKRVIIWSFAGSVPFMAIFFLTHSPLGVASLVIGGLVLLFTIPINVVVAQQLVPSQAGTVSALLMGFAWGASGMVFIPFTGWLADRTSLEIALASLLIYPALGGWLARMLPEDLGQ